MKGTLEHHRNSNNDLILTTILDETDLNRMKNKRCPLCNKTEIRYVIHFAYTETSARSYEYMCPNCLMEFQNGKEPIGFFILKRTKHPENYTDLEREQTNDQLSPKKLCRIQRSNL